MKSIFNNTNVYTFNGLKKIKDIDKEKDLILNSDASYSKIKDIVKTKGFKQIYKIKIANNIDNILCNKDNKVFAIQNLPYNIPTTFINNYFEQDENRPRPDYVKVENLTTFDYVGTPIPNFIEKEDYNYDYYRYCGILLYFNFNKLFLKSKDTVSFIKDYLKNENITYHETIKDDITIIFIDKNNLEKEIKLNYEILNKNCSIILLKGFFECSNLINDNYFINHKTTNKDIIITLKYILLKFGVMTTSYYITNNRFYIIKIPKQEYICKILNIEYIPYDYDYFIYNNYIWSAIKYINIVEFKGDDLYRLELVDNNNYATELGIIKS